MYFLTYFHPRGVLQHSQYMSATACNPVSSTRSSAWPQATFTLKHKIIFCNDFKDEILFFFLLLTPN